MDKTLSIIGKNQTTSLIRHLIFFACILCGSTQATALQQVIIVSDNENNHYKLLIDNILSETRNTDIKVNTFNIGQTINIIDNDSLVITLGHEASDFISLKKLTNPKLRVLTNSNVSTNFENNSKPYLSMTQPACQQFALAQTINPDWKNFSVLLSTSNKALTQNLEDCAKKLKLNLSIILLDKYINIIDALNSSLSDSDVMVALPDPTVYNKRTIKGILLTTYRHRVPIIGFSEGFVRAGALAAIHSTPEQLGKQIVELIHKRTNNQNLDKHLYPKYFDVITNRNVARSLGIYLPNDKVIKEKLQYKNHE